MDEKVSMGFNRNCFPKMTDFSRLGSYIHPKSGSINKMARDRHILLHTQIESIIWPIYSCQFQWPWMTLKVICLMQDLWNAFRRTFVRHQHGFNCHGASHPTLPMKNLPWKGHGQGQKPVLEFYTPCNISAAANARDFKFCTRVGHVKS